MIAKWYLRTFLQAAYHLFASMLTHYQNNLTLTSNDCTKKND